MRLLLILVVFTAYSFGVEPITVETAHSSTNEVATAAELEKLTRQYDLLKWTFTTKVVIDEKAIPHSDPVLTLHTKYLGSDDRLLSAYIHEQLHWFLDSHKRETDDAVADLENIYKNVPIGYPEGAQNERSTYEHLLVCYDEYQVDRELMGEERAKSVIEASAKDHYRWVYRTVLQDESDIRKIVQARKLLP